MNDAYKMMFERIFCRFFIVEHCIEIFARFAERCLLSFRDSRLARPQDSLVTLNFVSPRAKSLVFLVDDTNVMNSQVAFFCPILPLSFVIS